MRVRFSPPAPRKHPVLVTGYFLGLFLCIELGAPKERVREASRESGNRKQRDHLLAARTKRSPKTPLRVFCYSGAMSEIGNIVLIDMDNVMVDFDTAALANIPWEKIVPRSEFYVADDYDTALRPAIESVYNAPGFFESLEPMPGLLEAWQTMIDEGFEPQVASAPLSSNPTAVEGKIKWLDRVMAPHFGPGVVEEAIIDKHKWKYRGIALIDDRPDVPRGLNGRDDAEWQHILFGWSHLEKVPMATAAFRLMSWRDKDDLLAILNTVSH